MVKVRIPQQSKQVLRDAALFEAIVDAGRCSHRHYGLLPHKWSDSAMRDARGCDDCQWPAAIDIPNGNLVRLVRTDFDFAPLRARLKRLVLRPGIRLPHQEHPNGWSSRTTQEELEGALMCPSCTKRWALAAIASYVAQQRRLTLQREVLRLAWQEIKRNG